VFEYLKHASDYGLTINGEVDKDFDAVVARSRGVAAGMSKGVQFLMKKNKIEVIDGFGKVKPGKKVDVTDKEGKVTEYSADHIIIATGARSRELPNLPQDGAKAIEAGNEIKVGKFPFSASGKAQAGGTPDGFVKVIFDAKYGEWLGCHMIGAGVTDMIAEAVVARKLETTGYEILKAVHPHPTMSEAVMEAVADAYGEVIHL